MKKIMSLFCLNIVLLISSQSLSYDALIQYDVVSRAYGNFVNKENAFLLMNEKTSFYFNYKGFETDYENVFIDFNFKNNNFRYEYIVDSKNMIFSTKYDDYNFYSDKLPAINWQIINEHKEILGFHCQKAIGEFRGREYTVWFTDQIPYVYGPWKLNGLPGMILEAVDDTKLVTYTAIKISLNKTYQLPEKMMVELAKKESLIPYRNYVVKKEKILKQAKDKMMASLPKGTQIVGNDDVRDLSQEKNFEWEKKN